MKVKVGQWVRVNDNRIITLQEYYDLNGFNEEEYYVEEEYLLEFEPILALANTPQELIQVGDLVEFNDGDKMFVSINGNVITHSFNKIAFVRAIKNVTAIYTPNEDGTQYTLQWRKEE